jgi:hypothetical protein
VRALSFPFDRSIPRFWLFGNPYPTHIGNALGLLFPDGERFFIRSVQHYLAQIEGDPELLGRVRAFVGQEGRHGHEHERYNRVLEEQGYALKPFLGLYRKLAFDGLEANLSPVLRLSATAAIEHLTATLADHALRSDVLDYAHPVMRHLLKWHAAEEIEHKSVAFDVLQRVDPRWSTRAAGAAIGVLALLVFWGLGVRMLLRQEARRGTDLVAWRKVAELDPRLRDERRRRFKLFVRAIADYLRPDFHPDSNDNDELARSYLASIGRLEG